MPRRTPSSHVVDHEVIMWLLLPWLLFCGPEWAHAEYLGDLSANPYSPNSTANPLGAGNALSPNSLNNPIGPHGSPISPYSSSNPLATSPPQLFDQAGQYRGNLSANPLDPNSTSNPIGRYGSPISPDSLNNPLGAGNPSRPDSPRNPYGNGWRIGNR